MGINSLVPDTCCYPRVRMVKQRSALNRQNCIFFACLHFPFSSKLTVRCFISLCIGEWWSMCMWDMSSCRVGLRLRSDVFPSHSPSHLLRQDHSLNQKLTDWLGSGSPPPQHWGHTHKQWCDWWRSGLRPSCLHGKWVTKRTISLVSLFKTIWSICSFR